jgi:hypothetical protein
MAFMNLSDTHKLASRFINLPQDKRKLFLSALQQQGIDFSLFPIVSMVNHDDRHSLSYAQERMWFLWQLEPQAPTYNLPSAVRLKGYINIPIVNDAFNSLIARHQTLRTHFYKSPEGQAIPIINNEKN